MSIMRSPEHALLLIVAAVIPAVVSGQEGIKPVTVCEVLGDPAKFSGKPTPSWGGLIVHLTSSSTLAGWRRIIANANSFRMAAHGRIRSGLSSFFLRLQSRRLIDATVLSITFGWAYWRNVTIRHDEI